METELKNKQIQEHQKKNLTFGITLVIVGIVFLLERMNIATHFIHHYLLRWESLLILFGLLLIFIQKRYIGGFVLLVTGGYFIVDDFYFLLKDLHTWFLPLILIIVGLLFLFIPKKNNC